MDEALAGTRESLWRLIAGPLVWAAHFLLSYVTAAIVCAKFAGADDAVGAMRALLALYTLTALTLIAVCARADWRRYRRGVGTQARDDTGGRAQRHRFLGLAGLLLHGLSALAVSYTAAVVVLIRSCG